MPDLFKRIAELSTINQSFCVMTVVEATGSTPRGAGARGLVFPDGKIEGTVGGGSIEQEAIQEALARLKQGQPLLKKYTLEYLDHQMSCGGTMTIFFEPVLPQNLLTIFGGGHVGRALAQAAFVADWRIRVVDNREFVLDPGVFPPSSELIHSEYPKFIQNTNFSQTDWLVIATPRHQFDAEVLALIIDKPVAYLGMMGSEKKIQQVKTELAKKGIGIEAFNKVHAPIGLNIGTETPGEIAISIVAEMLAVKNKIKEIRTFSPLDASLKPLQ